MDIPLGSDASRALTAFFTKHCTAASWLVVHCVCAEAGVVVKRLAIPRSKTNNGFFIKSSPAEWRPDGICFDALAHLIWMMSLSHVTAHWHEVQQRTGW